jgi:hypothetical protein
MVAILDCRSQCIAADLLASCVLPGGFIEQNDYQQETVSPQQNRIGRPGPN